MSDPPRVSVRVSTNKSAAAAAGPPLPKKPPPPAVPAQPARGAVQNQAAAAFAIQQQKQQNALLHKQMQIANAQRQQPGATPVAAQIPGFTPQQVAQFAQQLPQLQQQQFAMLAPQQKAVYIQHQVRIQQLMQQLPQMTQQQQQQLYQQLTPQQQQQLAQLPPQQQQHHLVQFQKNLLVKQQQMLFAQLAQQAQAAAAGGAGGAVPQSGPTPLPQMPTPLPQMPQATTPAVVAAQPAPLPTLPVQVARPTGGVSVLPVMQAAVPEAEEPAVVVAPVITPQSFAQPLPVPQATTPTPTPANNTTPTRQRPTLPSSTPSIGSLPPPSLPRKPPVPSRPPAPGDRPEPPKPARSSSEKVVELSWPKEGNIFEKPDDPSQIIYETAEKSAKPKIKAATVEKLIEKATNPTSEPMMQKSFLLTYRSMDLTPYALMDLLVQRYSMPLPEGNEASLSVFKSKHQLPVQIRVCQLLKTWVQKHFYDFENDTKLQQMFLDFVVNTIKPQHSIGKQLEEIMHRQINGESTVIQITELPPKPILPKMKVNIQFTDIHPIELARQLTIIEWNIYKSIIPSECTGLAWSKKNAAERAPNVLAMIDRFNVVSNWVVSEILKPETQKQRVEVLGHFIEIAERCKGLNNFNGCMEIISGLGDASIHRLKSHWAELPKKASTIYTDLKAVLSSDQSYKSLRAYLKTCDGSCIPYLGMYLTDLTFIEDGNNDKISDLHNFSKRMFVANVIQEIQYYQQAPYVLEPVPAIQNFLATLAGKIMDKEACYQRSLQIIPRGGGAATTPATGGAGAGGAGGASTPVVARRGTEAAGEEDYGEMEQVPGYKFLEKDSNKNIRVQTNTQDTSSGGIKVVAGTLEKIVERVTYRTFPDPQFVEAFLLTYRSYTSGKQLLELLMMRFNMPVPKNPAVMERFKNEQQRPVQLRVINVLKNWTEKYFIDFVNERALLPMLTSFAENNQSHAGPLKQMIKKLRQKIQTYKSSDSKKPVLPATQSGAPAMHQQVSGSDRAPKVTDFHPEEVVRQICLYDFALLSMIHPLEMTNKTYQVDQRRAIHLLRFQRRQSAISNWVVNTLIQQANERRANLTLMIQMALFAYELRNFHLLAALKHGLSSSEVKSLSQTWESVDSKIIEKYEQLLTNVNAGLASLKAFQTKFVSNESLEEPGIPVVDLYLTELSNIEEKQNNLVDESLINILKARQMSTVVSDFLRFRNVPYNFEHHSWLQNYIQVDIDKFGDRDAFDDSSLSEQLSSMHPDKVKLAIKTQINEDPKLRNEMCLVIKKLLQEQLVNNEMQKLTNQVQTYKEQVNKELELVHQKFNPPGLNTLMDNILTTRFQDAEFNDWSFEDKDGNVYGWPENITVDTLTTGSGENYLYFLKSAFDKAELALIMRIAAFYEQFSGCDSPPKTLVFSSFIAANTRSVAQQSGIELISVS